MPQPTARDWFSIITLGVVWGATFMVVALALEGYGPVTVACARTEIGALMLPAARAMIAILVLGALPTAFATLLRVAVIRSAGPSFLSLVNYQVPSWSLGFGVVILNEALPGSFFAALGLILAGLGISQRKWVGAPRQAARRERIISANRSKR